MGEWQPLFIACVLLFTVGLIVPMLVSPFIPVGEFNQDSVVASVISTARYGYNLTWYGPFDIDIVYANVNPFSWFGDKAQEFMISQFSAFSYIPNYIAIPLIILIILGFTYTVFKLFRG